MSLPTAPPSAQPGRPAGLTQRVIAIDPSLRGTGFAVLQRAPQGRFRALAYGMVKNPAKLLFSGCLVAIREQITELVTSHQPDCAALEAIIYVQSFKTAITMGSARGAAVLAVAERGLPIYEYAPRRVKQAIVGRGGAEKAQVGYMVRAMVDGITGDLGADASDAIAIGMTHFQTENSAVRGATKLERI